MKVRKKKINMNVVKDVRQLRSKIKSKQSGRYIDREKDESYKKMYEASQINA